MAAKQNELAVAKAERAVAYAAGFEAGERQQMTAMAGWQPIETAPKDKTILLLTSDSPEDYDLSITVGYWGDPFCKNLTDDSKGSWIDYAAGFVGGEFDGIAEMKTVSPSHWMPLPDPPN